MRILYFINSLQTGGAERLVVDLAKEGISRGDEITIMTLSNADGVPRRYAKAHNIPLIELGLNRFDPRIALRLKQHERDFDIIHSHLFPAFYWASFGSRPLIFTEHSTSNRRMGKRIWNFTEKTVYRRYNQLIAITDGVSSSINEHISALDVETPITTILNGVRGEFYDSQDKLKTNAKPDTPLRLVAIGSLRNVKNFDLAIRVVAQLPQVTLDIIGEGPLRDELSQLVLTLQASSKIRLIGAVDNVATILPHYDVLLSTSKREGFGLVAAEAMAMGLPVIGPNISGFNEVVVDGETGFLFHDYIVSEITDLILRMFSSDIYRSLSQAALQHAKTFTISETYDSYRKIYELTQK